MRIARILLTGIIFLLLMAYGLLLALQKPLWIDECYSLTHSIYNISYAKILNGGINEGNNSPLFYILQKVQCDLFSYHPPQGFFLGNSQDVHLIDQLFLRVLPVFAGALSLSVLFNYFSRCNSIAIGFYALVLALTTSTFFVHWAEARPYSLWFSLSLFQILLLIKLLENSKCQDKKSTFILIVVHWLLALTTIVSVVQIAAAGLVLWLYHRRDISFYVFSVVIPLAIGGFYYFRAPHYSFYFGDSPLVLISTNFSIYRLFLIFMTTVFLIFHFRSENWVTKLEIQFLSFLILMLVAFGLILLKMKLGQSQGLQGFEISNRYFMSLAPMSIVGAVLYSLFLMRIFPSKIWAAVVVVMMLFTGLLVIHS